MVQVVNSKLHIEKRNILYYPTINIPTDDWLRNAVLYWDEVSSIIPQDWEKNHKKELSPDIKYLIDEGQFRSIRPDRLINDYNNHEILREFQKEIIAIVKSQEFKKIQKSYKERFYKIHDAKIKPKGFLGRGVSIHNEKMLYDLFEFLKEHKLARKIKDEWEWLNIEKNTALVYMSVLAKYLARMETQHTVVGTDLSAYEKLSVGITKKDYGAPVISCDFKGIIPSPRKNVSIKEIIRFKKKRNTNLIVFRKMLIDIEKKLTTAESNEHVKEVTTSFQEDLRKNLTDMAAVYKDAKIDMVLKSLKSLINFKSSTVVTGTAIALNEKYAIAGVPDWVKGVAIAAAGAIDVSTTYVDYRNKLRAEDRKNAFSYLYHAQRKGIVQ